jgi:hypothetical protein
MALANLFGGLDERPSWLLPAEINCKSELMQVLVEVGEYERPNDRAVEILLEGEYIE